MTALSAMMVLLSCALDPPDMASRVQRRLERLDKLVVGLTHEVYTAPAGASVLDPSNWRSPNGDVVEAFHHGLTVVRPNILDEWLDDDAQKGYEPVRGAVVNGTFVQEHLRPAPYNERFPEYSGRKHFTTSPTPQAGVFRWAPILHLMDIQFPDCHIPNLNSSELFERGQVQCVRTVSGVSTYLADVMMTGAVHHYEFDLDQDGNALRYRIVEDPDDDSLQPITIESYTVRGVEVNGAQLPTECLVAVYNPNADAASVTLHRFLIEDAVVDPSLSLADVQIEVPTRDAIVTVEHGDGTAEQAVLDEAGNTVKLTRIGYDPHPMVDAAGSWVPKSSLRWRFAIPVFALALAFYGFHLLHRRARRTI